MKISATPTLSTGLDVLIEDQLAILASQRVGLVSHPAAVALNLRNNVQALLEAGIRLTALFGPEHGFAASASDGVQVNDSRDTTTGLPTYSLYGANLEPTQEMFQQIDVLVADLQDVGVRFYTYLSTLFYLIQAAGHHHCPLIVLDRPNPINGDRMAGPVLEADLISFVGMVAVPIRHGMTLGELAQFINAEYGFEADLTVLPMRGWRREQWFDQTGRIWVPTSPGMPKFETTLVYPGTCLLEGTNLSEGRGTPLPFEILGAPWVDGHLLADRLNQRALAGIYARPAIFTPTSSKYRGETCHGVQLHVLDREVFSPIRTALEIISVCKTQYPDQFTFLPPYNNSSLHNHFDLLAGTHQLRRDLENGWPLDEITDSWQAGLGEFSKRRQPYLLYE